MEKICILCPAFPVSWDICGKSSYYVLLFLSAGTYAKKALIMSHTNVITGHL